MNKLIDANTFGKEKADIILANILNDIGDPRVTRYVGDKIRVCNELIHELKNSNNKMFMYTLLKDHFFNTIDTEKRPNEYPKIKTYLKNIIIRNLKVGLIRSKSK